ncbi:MAG: hypothetical protein ABSE73_25685 [Planctomycetota bacterium]
MASNFEIVNGILFVTGSLDKAADEELTAALSKYANAVPATSRVVDMTNVKWLAPTGGKAVISAGQETAEKGGSLRVLASRGVLQTLNLLGAKSWLSIEVCTTPNPHPGTPPALAAAPEAAKPAAAEAPKAAEAQPASAQPAAPGAAAPPAAARPAPAPVQSAEGPAPGGFVSPHEDLTGSAALLRILHPNRRYSFHLEGGELMIGSVRERVGGPWIVLDTAGTRKILNLEHVTCCEVL